MWKANTLRYLTATAAVQAAATWQGHQQDPVLWYWWQWQEHQLGAN